jgi:hypothetical protein
MRLSDLTVDLAQKAAVSDYVRLLSCYVTAPSPTQAAELFARRWPHAVHKDFVTKAATAAGSTTDTTWAGPLAVPALADAFLAIVRASSLLGRIPGLVKVPFNVTVPIQTAPGAYYWVAQGAPKPVTKLGFGTGVTLTATKCAGIVVTTRELAQLTRPGTEAALQNALVSGLTAFTDSSFLLPSLAAVPDKNPASITNGVTPTTAGATIDDSVAAVLGALFAQRPGAIGAVLLASPATAAKLAATGKNLDARVSGGSVHGVALVPTEAAGAMLVAVDPSGVAVADNGVVVDPSDQATVEMNDAPVGTAAAVITSLWQTNLTGFRVERFVNWQAVPGAVQYVAAV